MPELIARSTGSDSDGDSRIIYDSALGLPTDLVEVPGDQDKSLEVKKKDKVPDGGYGWFIVLGCFISHVIIGGFERNDGVYYLQFKAQFGKSAQLTSWPGAIVSTIRLFLGPVASALCNRFSVRSTVMIGSILFTVSQILTAFTPNFYFLFFSHAALQGIARGLVYTPSLVIVNMYFDKYRGVAAGLGSSGVGVGTFALVPLTQFLFDTYGFTSTFLILAGVALNCAVVAMLFRPLSLHNKFTLNNRTKRSSKYGEDRKSEAAETKDTAHVELLAVNGELTSQGDKLEEIQTIPKLALSKEEKADEMSLTNPVASESAKVAPVNKGFFLRSSLEIWFPIENKKTEGQKKKLFNFMLLKDPSFLMFCLSICLFTISFKSAFTFIPALVKSKGISETEAALVLSITGVFDTIGRIAAGLILDRPFLQKVRPMLYNSLVFAIALASFTLPSLNGFVTLCIMSSIYGSLTGAYISQKSVVIVDILGVENMTNSFGLLVSFQSMGMCIGPPLSGFFRDTFGRFDEAFYLGGGSMIVAGFLMMVSNIFLRMRKRRELRQKTPVLEKLTQ